MESETNDASMSRAGLWVASIIGVALLGFAAWQYLPGGGESDDPGENGSPAAQGASFQPPPAGAVSVTAAAAHRGELVMRITANGIAEAERLLRVAAEVQGKIDEVAVSEGTWVEAGSLLVSLDDFELQLTRDQTEEALLNRVMVFADKQLQIPGETATGNPGDSSEKAIDFLRRMISEEGYQTLRAQPQMEERLSELSREDLFAAQAELTAQRVALERAELNLARAKITAPFGGQVAGIEATSGPNSKSWPVVGQHVGQGNELMLLVDPDPIHLRVEVIESEISFVREGRRAEVEFQALPGETFYGTIEAVDPVVDADRKTLSVLVTLPNPDHRLKPGMFAQVVLDTEIFQDRLLVPADAVLVRDQNRPLVFVVQNRRAQWSYITPGLQNDEWIEVLDGVAEGDLIITSGHFTLAHDTPVNVIDPEGGEGAQ